MVSVSLPHIANPNIPQPTYFFQGRELLTLNGVGDYDRILDKTEKTNAIEHVALPYATLSTADQDYLTNLNSLKRESNAFLTD